MTLELAGAILCFVLTVAAFLFSLAKSSRIEPDAFPNKARYFTGLGLWMAAAILAVFMSFPGYALWFVPSVYPLMKIILGGLFLTGLFLLVTTVVAFPLHLNHLRRESVDRSDKFTLLDTIHQIAGQPYPVTELFTLSLREVAQFLGIPKGAIFLANPSRREMYLTAQVGLDKEEMSRLERFPLGQDLVSRAAGEQESFISGDLAASDAPSRKLLLAGRDMTLSAAAVPLIVRDKSLGVLLVLSDQPYRFDKPDRMILTAVAEALARVVETSRLTRENQKLLHQIERHQQGLATLNILIGQSLQGEGRREALEAVCRYLTERFQVLGCRVVKLALGELEDEAGFEAIVEPESRNESYNIAVIDGIRRKKAVILNQEARDRSGAVYIARSTLLCPVPVREPGEFALLVEARGNSLILNEAFLAEVDGLVGLVAMNLNMASLKETDDRNQTTVRALLNILRIKPDRTATAASRQFLEELSQVIRPPAVILVFGKDDTNGYRLLDGRPGSGLFPVETVFMPGEGPVGKAAAGEVQELRGREKVEEAWTELDTANQDFIPRLLGERGIPDYQVNVPIRVLDEIVGVAALFGYDLTARTAQKEIGFLRLATELLSIRLSMARLRESRGITPIGEAVAGQTHLINQANNDLATVLGRAELLSRQSDLPGNIRYTTDEIIRAAESAAAVIKNLQEGMKAADLQAAPADQQPLQHFAAYLERHRITGNLYAFDDNRPVMLQVSIEQASSFSSDDPQMTLFFEKVFAIFIGQKEDTDEILVKSGLEHGRLYFTVVRGAREKNRLFEPSAVDYGDATVIPEELLGREGKALLIRHRGEVSFDRFGRRPTYLSFRFISPELRPDAAVVEPGQSGIAGLKILAVDDQQMILDLLAGISASLGVQLTTAQEAGRALELFRRERFDMVMVDLMLGESSGWEVARQIKLVSPETPVILMTGMGLSIGPEEAARGGVDFTLAKPFKIEQLTEVIQKARLRQIPS